MPHLPISTKSEESKLVQKERRRIARELRAKGWTLTRIGLVLNVSRERVRSMIGHRYAHEESHEDT